MTPLVRRPRVPIFLGALAALLVGVAARAPAPAAPAPACTADTGPYQWQLEQ
ncbi:hypothetical protein ACFVYD_04200 [Streptomyces sp. NPDC058301]|uniref:hypothetical protein n=1 Tax=Streptomyces sp. NPDC058301 TaxID=3346436 RepID=UPI0036E41F54